MSDEFPYRQMVEQCSQGFWLIDRDGHTKYASTRTEEMLAAAGSELCNKEVWDLVLPADIPQAKAKLSLVDEGRKADFELRFMRGDGSECRCCVTACPVKGAPGDALLMLTEIGRHEERLRELGRAQGRAEAEKLAEINRTIAASLNLHDVTAAICRAARQLTGADGATFIFHEDDKVHYADEDAIAPLWKGKRFQACNCISGWAIIHRSPAIVEDIYSDPRIPIEAYRPTFVKSLAIMPGRPGWPVGAVGVYWARRHKASEHELALLGALVDAADVALVNAQLYEQSQRARCQAELAQEELRTAIRQKDEFLANLSHELRTPLHIVLGWSRQLLKTTVDRTTVHAAEVIERNARAQAQLIDDLLDVSHSISGKLQLDVRQTEIIPAIEASLEAIRPAATAKNIQLESILDRNTGMVLGDPERLQQVVWNLLSNAVKFTPPGGLVKIELSQANSHLQLKISDSGEGIAPEVLPCLFQRFLQADSSTSRRHGGLGLGLALVRHLVELHGGNVEAYSAGKGKGAVFTVRLPVGRQTGCESAGAADAISSSS